MLQQGGFSNGANFMSADIKDDLKSFHDFVGKQLGNGGAQLTPEQVLALWRERLNTIESVHRGLEDVEAGRTRPADQAIDQLRQELLQP